MSKKRNVMKKVLITLLLISISASNIALAQDTMLALMKNRSEFVLHVQIIDIQGGESDEAGVENWWAKYKIIQPIKGDMRKDWQGIFYFNRFTFKEEKEVIPIEKGKEYIIFLKGNIGKFRFPNDEGLTVAHTLIDKWIGILQYNDYLIERLIKYTENK